MTVTIGINGFGRIGRCTLAQIAESGRNDVQVVKINATGPIETNAHLLKYDSVHGRFPNEIRVTGNEMDLGRGPMEVMSTRNLDDLDWSGVDVVLECTGAFNDGEKAKAHLERGAKKGSVPASIGYCGNPDGLGGCSGKDVTKEVLAWIQQDKKLQKEADKL